jgi:amidophosphoribosyltransferase
MCAIFGITGEDEAANLTYLGLHAMQHRGQEGSGIVSTQGAQPYSHRRKGLVGEVFSTSALARLKGRAAVGHNRYSTTGGNTLANLQPLLMRGSLGWLAIAHNGNLVNAQQLTTSLEREGAIFQTTSDTEVILHLIARSREKDIERALIAALERVEGAYSLLVLSEKKLIAVRDPYGFRPLVMGDFHGRTVFASETCAFDLIGAEPKREVEPGEMIVVSHDNTADTRSVFPFGKKERRRCIFEHIYFARPDTVLYGEQVHSMRKLLGRRLAQEQPAPGADVVIPVPDSGVPAAIGFAEQSKIPFDMGIIRSHYIGRTFIEPKQSIRDFGVKLKLNPVSACVRGKSVVVVDDSLVRGTTSRKLIQHLREAGAATVHMRICAPPTTHSCFYGIDTPTRKELVAASQSLDRIRDTIGADSLGYLSLDGLVEVASERVGAGFCHACFSGEYPTPLSE